MYYSKSRGKIVLGIILDEKSKISDVQEEMGRVFPYLKIEFYNFPYHADTLPPRSKMFDSEKELRYCFIKHEGVAKLVASGLKLNPAFTVGELEEELWNEFGLSTKVFRKSGNHWIATTLTRSWTLFQQNLEGEQLSSLFFDGENIDITEHV